MIEYLYPLAAYLLGSISSAVLVARLFRLEDPRETGSGNPGATNILRYGGKKAAILTLVGDVLKGVAAVAAARLAGADAMIIAAVMVAAFVGHLYPIFFRFKGGKGVATGFGVCLAANPWVGGAMALTWITTAATTRYSSLAALAVTLLSPLYIWYWLREPAYIIAGIVIGALLVWRHRANLARLAAGTESKIGSKS